VACRLHYAFPDVRFWEPVGSEHGNGGPLGPRPLGKPGDFVRTFCTVFQGRTFGVPGLTAPAVSSEDGREQSRGKSGQGDPP